jgi:hypothetical protein
MPPQIDKVAIPLDENEKIEQSLSSDNNQNVFNIEKYLLILLFIQWVSSKESSLIIFRKNQYFDSLHSSSLWVLVFIRY